MSYIEELYRIDKPSFEKIINLAVSRLPENLRRTPWVGLNHGVDLLDTEDKLNQYLCAYGMMHKEKIITALSSINNPLEEFSNGITIIDWGCGQGLATVCFFDYLSSLGISPSIRKVILVEPSRIAIERAQLHTHLYLADNSKIQCINKYINDVTGQDIEHTPTTLTLHFFSNILDIDSVNLVTLANLVSHNLTGRNILFCVGPANLNSNRIEEFAGYFNITQNDILNNYRGNLTTRGTIRLLVFKKEGDHTEIIKTEYNSATLINNNNNAELDRILSRTVPANNEIDKIIQFYKLSVDLERSKEPNNDEWYKYPFNRIDEHTISVDFQSNKDFVSVFEKNRSPRTNWPKNLCISICIVCNNQVYDFLQYIVPFDQIRDIRINENTLSCSLHSFSVNQKVANSLEITDEQIYAIDSVICNSQNTLQDVLEAIKEYINLSIVYDDSIHLSLSQKAIALSQIYAELKNLNSILIRDSLLSKAFLLNNPIDNKIGNIRNEELIEICDMDNYQRQAVTTALNNRVSVITGPPGCGKTQVILNIMANALLHNKKVLVASKNNKAVDNVKERFDTIDSYHYLLRFGNKETLSQSTIPEIDRFINLMSNNKEDNSYENLFLEYQNACNALIDAKDKITERDRLIGVQNTLNEEMNGLKDETAKLEERYRRERQSLINENLDKESLRPIDSSTIEDHISLLRIRKNVLDSKYSGMGKLIINWFTKRKYAAEILNQIESYPQLVRNYIHKGCNLHDVKEFKSGADVLSLYDFVINLFSKVIDYRTSLEEFDKEFEDKSIPLHQLCWSYKYEFERNQVYIDKISRQDAQLRDLIEKSKRVIHDISIPLLKSKIENNISTQNGNVAITNYKKYLPLPQQGIPNIMFTNDFLTIFQLIAVTSLSIKSAFPLQGEIFDMVIIDEASQCDIASALPLLYRTKQLVVIGDPMQLKHISKISLTEEQRIKDFIGLHELPYVKYKEQSLWDYSKDYLVKLTGGTEVVNLKGHYRCHPHIIGYSNFAFYQNRMGMSLNINTSDNDYNYLPKGIVWIDVPQGKQKADNVNINEMEVNIVCKKAIEILRSNNDKTVGIVTPFKRQAEEISRQMPNDYIKQVTIGTVHTFQGDEKDIMLFSLVVTANSPERKIRWIDISTPNIVNVAVTRAKNTLYVIGNKEYIRQMSRLDRPLGALLNYVESYMV